MEELALRGFLDAVYSHEPGEGEDLGEPAAIEPVPYTVESDGSATFQIKGVLRKSPVPSWYREYGIVATSYLQIIETAKRLEADPSITKVEIEYDTPGGMVDGVDDAYQALRSLASKKEVVSIATGMIASAGYYLAVTGNKIVSKAPTNMIGSIGVLVAYVSFKKMDEKWGINEIIIISSNAPNKAPDPETEDGRREIQARVDALERIFYSRISESRVVSVDKIAKDFGRGGVYVSYDPDSSKPSAIKAGMIDFVIGHTEEKKPKEKKHMASLEELLGQPDNAGARSEVEGLVSRAQQSANDKNQAKIKKVAPYLNSEVYPAPIRALAVKALEGGEHDVAALVSAVAVYDALKEQSNSQSAQQQTTDTPETPPQGSPADGKDPVAALDEMIAKDKKAQGR